MSGSVEILETITRYLTFTWYSLREKLNVTKMSNALELEFGTFEIWYQQNDLFQFYNQFYFGVCVIKYLRSHRSILEMVSRNLRRSDDFRVWQKVSPRKQSPWLTRLNNITHIACHARHDVESYAVIIVPAQR